MKGIAKDHKTITKDYENLFYSTEDIVRSYCFPLRHE